MKISENRVLYEDNHLIAIAKLTGELVQGDRTGDLPLSSKVELFLKEKYDKPGNVYVGTIHRLDRPASGVVVFAKTSKALSRMNELFAKRKVSKEYFIISKFRSPEFSDTLKHYLYKTHVKNTSKAYSRPKKGAKEAVLHYELVYEGHNEYLYKIKLSTGRPHQIRVQMSAIGCPVLGDFRYGSRQSLDKSSIALHCSKVEFLHPVKNTHISIETPFPKLNFWDPYRTIDL